MSRPRHVHKFTFKKTKLGTKRSCSCGFAATEIGSSFSNVSPLERGATKRKRFYKMRKKTVHLNVFHRGKSNL